MSSIHNCTEMQYAKGITAEVRRCFPMLRAGVMQNMYYTVTCGWSAILIKFMDL